MAVVNDGSDLIDLHSSIQEQSISIPLLPVPILNEIDVSGDDNNPFDSASLSVSNHDDPFEVVAKKTQEFTERKSDHSGNLLISDETCTSNFHYDLSKVEEYNKTKSMSTLENKNDTERMIELTKIRVETLLTNREYENGPENQDALGYCQTQAHYKTVQSLDLLSHMTNGYSTENRPKAICNLESLNVRGTANLIQPVNNAITVSSEYYDCSPETTGPKYCSTPLHNLASFKRKIGEEGSPYKVEATGNEEVCTVSLVEARINRCIAEAEESFKRQKELSAFGKKTICRKSLDSQLLSSPRFRSTYRRETNFRCDQNLLRKNLPNFADNTDAAFEFHNTYKSLQKPRNKIDLHAGIISNLQNVEDTKPFSVHMADGKVELPEAQFLSKLFKAKAAQMGNERLLADESVVNFIETDEEEETCENGEAMKRLKRKNITGRKAKNIPEDAESEQKYEEKMHEELQKSSQNRQDTCLNNLESNSVVDERSSKSIMSKVLGKMQSFTPKKETSMKRRYSGVIDTRKNNEKPTFPQNTTPRTRSDSNIAFNKEQMAKSSKYSSPNISRSSNTSEGVKSTPQSPKQTMAKCMGKVSKPPKPLSMMFQNRKNLFTGKPNIRSQKK